MGSERHCANSSLRLVHIYDSGVIEGSMTVNFGIPQ
jgi:hypothetical protein